MKLLYIVPSVSNEGGVARVLSIKTNYLIEKFGYQIHILTQNQGSHLQFYNFNEKITFHDIILKGSLFQFFNSYKNSLKENIAAVKPDVIIVCDNGLKAFLMPFILDKGLRIIFESHGSKYIEENDLKLAIFSKFVMALKYKIKTISAGKFTKLVALSVENLKEWDVKNGLVISNPSWLKTDVLAELESKKVIAVARNSYEKGLDRLLLVWEKVIKAHPDWVLEVYGKGTTELEEFAKQLGIDSKIYFFEPVTNIESKYRESSICIMTSHTEGLPMVLIEAMASGLPCVAYDCPVGPRSIIKDEENGFLIENGNIDLFVEKLSLLIENEDIRKRLGEKAQISVANYDLDAIMKQWQNLFESLLENKKLL